MKKLSKLEINNLPLKHYRGCVEVVCNKSQVEQACLNLEKESVIGFDTETRPAFIRGEKYPPSLLQLAGEEIVYIFQLGKTGLCKCLINVLSDKSIIKTGVAIKSDLNDLKQFADFNPAGFVDLGEVAEERNIPHHGLRGLAAWIFGFRISKQARTSNWSKNNLSEKQIIYAATDAWVGRNLYQEFNRRKLLLRN